MHISLKMDRPIEIINIVPLNPLISKCQIKVCWVGEEANRNKSVITKEVAREMANSIPGSPIVGYYDEMAEDFMGHEKELEIIDGELRFKEITRPYGFVDLNAKCWFEWFLDDGINEREYLVTEGYLWTGQYPECQRVITRGNNQSMELDEKLTHGNWARDKKGDPQFFIINEAIMSKLCILGESVEPCFEGASIKFSLEDNFKNELFTMMNSLKEILSEGGTEEMEDNKVLEEVVETPVVEETVTEETSTDFSENSDNSDEITENKTENNITEENAPEFSEDKKDDEEVCPKCGKPVSECDCEDEKEEKKTYNLEEVVEYSELLEKYNALVAEKETLSNEVASLTAEIAPLKEFKNAAELKEKQAMVNSFYMLSEEDKKEVVENINNYSVDEIECKLAVICVRNKVSFALEDEVGKEEPTIFNLNEVETVDSGCPGWIKAAEAVKASKNK